MIKRFDTFLFELEGYVLGSDDAAENLKKLWIVKSIKHMNLEKSLKKLGQAYEVLYKIGGRDGLMEELDATTKKITAKEKAFYEDADGDDKSVIALYNEFYNELALNPKLRKLVISTPVDKPYNLVNWYRKDKTELYAHSESVITDFDEFLFEKASQDDTDDEEKKDKKDTDGKSKDDKHREEILKYITKLDKLKANFLSKFKKDQSDKDKDKEDDENVNEAASQDDSDDGDSNISNNVDTEADASLNIKNLIEYRNKCIIEIWLLLNRVETSGRIKRLLVQRKNVEDEMQKIDKLARALIKDVCKGTPGQSTLGDWTFDIFKRFGDHDKDAKMVDRQEKYETIWKEILEKIGVHTTRSKMEDLDVDPTTIVDKPISLKLLKTIDDNDNIFDNLMIIGIPLELAALLQTLIQIKGGYKDKKLILRLSSNNWWYTKIPGSNKLYFYIKDKHMFIVAGGQNTYVYNSSSKIFEEYKNTNPITTDPKAGLEIKILTVYNNGKEFKDKLKDSEYPGNSIMLNVKPDTNRTTELQKLISKI